MAGPKMNAEPAALVVRGLKKGGKLEVRSQKLEVRKEKMAVSRQ
jgi:hypothetical protein